MNQAASTARPGWVSEEMFPFESRFFTTPSGHRMHYVDEGEGEPIVFVHGNPSWSFEFRNLIAGLRSERRCVAPDHIGFGLSARSDRREDHHPEAHARAFAALLDHLDLKDITLFMTDWGGPIGLDFARLQPDRVKRIVVANTWCWPVADDFHFTCFSFLMSSWLGQFMVKRRNMFVTRVMPKAVGDRSCLTPEVIAHYRNAQSTPHARAALAALPGHIVGASDWLGTIWRDRAAFADKPALILWGHKDIAFRKKELGLWRAALSQAEVREFPDCGHFLAEEAPKEVLGTLRDFMG
ncbi:MAG: alpha/beta fold hydrolase [Rhodospirillales bacterium]|nr:alpha/beta fold hydrolase [Rhodospirillales bacterium]